GPEPYLGYTASMVERAAELRADAAALGGLQERVDARAYVIAGELVILKKAAGLADPLFAIEQPPTLGETAEIVFLGFVDQAPRFAVAVDPTSAEGLKAREDLAVTDL